MKLNKRQRTKLLEWIAEGLESGEINKRAAKHKPPFEVTRQQVDHYRKTRDVDLSKVKAQEEFTALKSGLALKVNRVQVLQELATQMSNDLHKAGLLWLDQVKGIGGAENFERVEYKEFNTAEVQQLRGVLDDIAAEVNERIKTHEVTGKNGGPIPLFNMDTWKQEREKRLKTIKDLEE